MPLMDPGVHSRFRIAAIFRMFSVFPMTAIFALIAIIPATSVARKNAAGSGE